MSNNVVTAEGVVEIAKEPLWIDGSFVWKGTLKTGYQNSHHVFFVKGASDVIESAIKRAGYAFWVRIQGKLVSFLDQEPYILVTYVLPATMLRLDEYESALLSKEYREVASILADGFIQPYRQERRNGRFSAIPGDAVLATILTDKVERGGAHEVLLKGKVREIFLRLTENRSGFHAVVQGKILTLPGGPTRILAAGLHPSGRFATSEFKQSLLTP